MLAPLHGSWDHFPATTAELSSCRRDCMAQKAKTMYYLAIYKTVSDPALDPNI